MENEKQICFFMKQEDEELLIIKSSVKKENTEVGGKSTALDM